MDRVDQGVDDRGGEALRRLVHEHQGTVQQERAPDRQHLLLAAGQLRAAVAAPVGEAREELVDGVGRPALAARALGQHPQVLIDRQRREEPAALRDVGDARARDRLGLLLRQVDAVERDGAAGGAHQAHQRRAQGGLAHAVAADDADGLDAHRERHTVEHLRRAVPGGQAGDLEDRLGVLGHQAASLPR